MAITVVVTRNVDTKTITVSGATETALVNAHADDAALVQALTGACNSAVNGQANEAQRQQNTTDIRTDIVVT